MKQLFVWISCLLLVYNCFAQNSGILWQKELPPNFNNNHSGVIFQGMTIDSSNNIYICYSLNGCDTTSSIISKVSPTGELLWRRTLLPNGNYQGVYTQFDYQTLLYIDQDENLVLCAKGYDSLTQNQIMMFKFDSNGNLILKGGMGNVINLKTWDMLPIQCDEINGNIYFPLMQVGEDTMVLSIYCFDKNFNYQFTTERQFYRSTHGYFFHPDYIQINIIDSLLFIQTSDVNPDYTDITCSNLYTNVLKFSYSDARFLERSRVFKVGSSYIFMGPWGIFKFDQNGVKQKELLVGIQNPSYQNGLFFFNHISYHSQGLFLIPYNSLICSYDPLTDSIQTKQTVIPGYITPITFQVFPSDNSLYSFGVILDDTIKIVNGLRTYYFARHDMQGNVVDYFTLSFTQPGWTQQGLALRMDRKNDFIGFQTVREPMDSTWVRDFNYLIKGSFKRKSNMKGICYFDQNSNCQLDSFENGIPNNLIRLMPEDVYTTTDSLGRFEFSKLSGSAQLHLVPAFNAPICDSVISVVCSDSVLNDSLNFGYKPAEGLFCQASIHSLTARPGFDSKILCYVSNPNLFKIYNVRFQVKLDSVFAFVTSNVAPDSINGSRIYFHLDSLEVGGQHLIDLTSHVPVNVPIGYSYTHRIEMDHQVGSDKCSMQDTTTGIVTGSFDPNDKLVEPIGKGPFHMIPNSTEMKYTIRFQNTGTDTAFNIRIIDKLDDNLDVGTFKLLAQSHPVSVRLDNQNILTFTFRNVKLVDSNRNEQLSHGFVQYSIKPKSGMDGREIKNYADIYFDYNAPVRTNTTRNTIGNYVEPRPVLPLNFDFFPNPLRSRQLMIKLTIEQQDAYTMDVVDAMGKVIQNVFTKQSLSEGSYSFSLELKNPASGLYFVQLQSNEQKLRKTKKLIVDIE